MISWPRAIPLFSSWQARCVNGVSVVLIAVAAWLAASVSWQLLLPPRLVALAVQTSALNPVASTPAGSSLFGSSGSKTVPLASSGKLAMTSLPLTLTGLLASNDVRYALAVISWQDQQNSYREGDTLPLEGVSVHKILADGVVLAQPDGLRKLNFTPQPGAAASLDGSLARQVIQNPRRLFDYLSIAPVRNDSGVLLGYRINPGNQPDLFINLGFLPGDLTVAINGVDLRNSAEAQALLLQLPQLTSVTVSVERGGQRHDITVSLDGETS